MVCYRARWLAVATLGGAWAVQHLVPPLPTSWYGAVWYHRVLSLWTKRRDLCTAMPAAVPYWVVPWPAKVGIMLHTSTLIPPSGQSGRRADRHKRAGRTSEKI